MSSLLRRVATWSVAGYGLSLPFAFLVGGGMLAKPERRALHVDSLAQAMPDGADTAFLAHARELRIAVAPRQTLAATVIGGDGLATVVVLHAAGGNRADAVVPAYALWRAGFDVVLIDRWAHGASDGDALPLFAGESESLAAMIDSLVREQWTATRRIGLFGMRDGGTACLVAAARDERVDAVAAEDPAARAADFVTGRLAARFRVPEIVLLPPAFCALLGASMFAGVERAEFDARDALRELEQPALLLTGEGPREARLARLVLAAAKATTADLVPLETAAGADRYGPMVEFFRRNL